MGDQKNTLNHCLCLSRNACDPLSEADAGDSHRVPLLCDSVPHRVDSGGAAVRVTLPVDCSLTRVMTCCVIGPHRGLMLSVPWQPLLVIQELLYFFPIKLPLWFAASFPHAMRPRPPHARHLVGWCHSPLMGGGGRARVEGDPGSRCRLCRGSLGRMETLREASLLESWSHTWAL